MKLCGDARRWFERIDGIARSLIALATITSAGCTTTPPIAPSAAGAWHHTELGLCEDYPEETRTLPHAVSDIALAHQCGARVLRVGIGWDGIETARGVYDWSFWDAFVRAVTQSGDVRLIPYVCYTPRWAASDSGENYWRSPPRDPADYARFMRMIASRYRSEIASWELWNEPDNPAYWSGTETQFAELVRAGSAAVRAANPRATIVLGGIATRLEFLEHELRDEHVASAVDVVNVHAYFETWHPDPIESLPAYVGRAEQIVAKFGRGEPLWLAETGYSTVGARAKISDVYRATYREEHSPLAQANALARTLVLAMSTGELPVVAWYRINDLPPGDEVIGDDNNRHLGVRAMDGRPKPALQTLSVFGRWLQRDYRTISPEVIAAPRDAEIHAFEFSDGTRLVAAWLPMPRSAALAQIPVEDLRAGSVVLAAPGSSQARVLDATGAVQLQTAAGQRDAKGRLTLKLHGSDVVLCVVER